jgi:hypothetical protein
MAAVRTVKLPTPTGNEGSTPQPWSEEERPQLDYPGAPRGKDPSDNSKDVVRSEPEDFPGSGVPGEPWKGAPAPPARRLRRDK